MATGDLGKSVIRTSGVCVSDDGETKTYLGASSKTNFKKDES